MRRSVPKKKLSGAEMVEINRRYCILCRCEQHLTQLQNPETASTWKSENAESAATPQL